MRGIYRSYSSLTFSAPSSPSFSVLQHLNHLLIVFLFEYSSPSSPSFHILQHIDRCSKRIYHTTKALGDTVPENPSKPFLSMAAAKSSRTKSKGFHRRTNSFSSGLSDSLDAIKTLTGKTTKLIKRCVSKLTRRLSKEAKHHQYCQTQVPRENGEQPGDRIQRPFEKKDREEKWGYEGSGSSVMLYALSTDSDPDNGRGRTSPTSS